MIHKMKHVTSLVTNLHSKKTLIRHVPFIFRYPNYCEASFILSSHVDDDSSDSGIGDLVDFEDYDDRFMVTSKEEDYFLGRFFDWLTSCDGGFKKKRHATQHKSVVTSILHSIDSSGYYCYLLLLSLYFKSVFYIFIYLFILKYLYRIVVSVYTYLQC